MLRRRSRAPSSSRGGPSPMRARHCALRVSLCLSSLFLSFSPRHCTPRVSRRSPFSSFVSPRHAPSGPAFVFPLFSRHCTHRVSRFSLVFFPLGSAPSAQLKPLSLKHPRQLSLSPLRSALYPQGQPSLLLHSARACRLPSLLLCSERRSRRRGRKRAPLGSRRLPREGP